ncbi:putative outer membrane starch-binding protein [Kordia periserrulae]|uniref:Putative outer membrane starch-binding protein n=1 Tax=Kordia periserrulae TaxID=701523 RepID=A0A2T6C086_9FLAO|nr:RagB/SusD family nutrient uptake outer membrane protein [Kordia periserrulae]PTX61733.1 putative outer membrane starch-binding protein [Kordia periserrulae]
MKNIHISNLKITFILLVSSITFSSCEYLEEEPLTQINIDEFYQNESDALAGLSGAYAQLKSQNGYYRQQFLSNLHAASDQGPSSFNHGDFRRGTITSAEPLIERTWIDIYACIKDANNVIARVPEVPQMDEELRLRIIGEARFLRALNYFNLVRCYGEVPLRTTPVTSGEEGLPLSPLEDIYNVIIADLEFAAQHCWGFNEVRNGTTNEVGRVTKAAAHAMLAKVYVQMASSLRTAQAGVEGNSNYLVLSNTPSFYYQKAIDEANATLQEPYYALTTNLQEYQSIFEATNGNNPEMLFEIQGASIAGQGTAVSNLYSPRNAGLSGGGFGGVNRFRPAFVNNSIDKFDPRYADIVINSYQDETFTYQLGSGLTGYMRTRLSDGTTVGNLFVTFTGKYIDTDATTEYTSQQNWHVIRLADVYLLRAEALAELNQNPALANPDINALRNRVGLGDVDYSGLTMEDFREELLRERGVELHMEGHRFFDLTRLGVYDEYCRIAWGNTVGARGPEDYTWPVPLIEVSSNPNID